MNGQRWSIFLRSLPTGGVERQFTTLANLLSRNTKVVFLTIFSPEQSPGELLDPSVEFHTLFREPAAAKTPLPILLKAPSRLASFCKNKDIGTLYSAREVANWVAARGLRKVPNVKLIWGHRSSYHKFSWRIRIIQYLCRMEQSRVQAQIANSQEGLEAYRRLGLCRRNAHFLPNFIDLEKFFPSRKLRRQQREAWGIPDSAFLIGLIGRIAEMKGHREFLRMAESISQEFPHVRFLIAGSGSSKAESALEQQIAELKIPDRIIFRPAFSSSEMTPVYNALDLLCSTSLYGEGFSNVLSEAMACGIPVVATKVGESPRIVGDERFLVQPGDIQQLTETVSRIIKRPPNPEHSGLRRDQISKVCDAQKILRKLKLIAE